MCPVRNVTYVSGRSQPPPLVGQVAFALPRRSGWVSDQGSWSDTPAFHNTLVVGSSPTSSTTQSRSFANYFDPVLAGDNNGNYAASYSSSPSSPPRASTHDLVPWPV